MDTFNSRSTFFMTICISFLLSSCFIINFAEATSSASVEEYIGNWCERQFKEDFQKDNNKNNNNSYQKNDVPIEPYIGKWCEEQFADQFVSSSVDLEEIMQQHYIDNDYDNVEIQLREWGYDNNSNMNSQLQLEPYLVSWCLATFGAESFKDNAFVPMLLNIASSEEKRIPIELHLGEWCLDSFPYNFASSLLFSSKQNILAKLARLYDDDPYNNIEHVEDDILRWYDAIMAREIPTSEQLPQPGMMRSAAYSNNIDNNDSASSRKKIELVIGIGTLMIGSVVGIIIVVGLVARRKQSSGNNNSQSSDNNNKNNDNEDGGIISSIERQIIKLFYYIIS